jgi:heme-degrading monooxygenase HmoA
MYMKIGWGKIQPGQWEAFEAAYSKAVDVPIEGLRGRWLARDTEDPNGAHSITLWESLDALHAYESSEVYNAAIVPACEEYFGNMLTVHVSEVSRSW